MYKRTVNVQINNNIKLTEYNLKGKKLVMNRWIVVIVDKWAEEDYVEYSSCWLMLNIMILVYPEVLLSWAWPASCYAIY